MTIKPIFRPEEEPNIPKLNIKPVVKPAEEVPSNNETIPKLTIKAVSNNSNNFEKVVPKLIVKIPPQTPDYSEHTDSSSPSPPIVHKLNIKPIPYPNEMPQDSVPKILIKLPQPEHYNHQKAEKVEKVEKTFHEEIPPQLPPLEVNTSTVKSMDSGQDSPRIILKINKTNKETITSEFIPAPTSTSTNLVTSGSTSVTSSSVEEKPMSITSSFNNHQTHNNKRAAKVTNDDCELPKKLKISTSEVIMINDDTNSGDEASQIKEKNGSRIEASHKNLSGILSKMQKPTESSKPQPEEDEPMEEEQEIFIQKNMLLINEDNEGSSSDCVVVQDDPLNSALSNSLSNDVDLVTPKRGRGRPKKIHTISAVQSEDEVPKSNKVRRGKNIPVKLPNPGTEEKVKEKKSKKEKPEETPENHKVSALKSRGSGRGRGRGRSKRTIEVIKDGKPVKITLDRDDDDDSPSFSIWNRNASGRGARKLRGRGSANRAGNNSGRKGEFTSPAANEPKVNKF